MRTLEEIEADIAFVKKDIDTLGKMGASTGRAMDDLIELLDERRIAKMEASDLRFNARRGTSVPYDSPTPNLTRQLQRLVTEERPGACIGCGYENSCSTRGCAVLRSVSRMVAIIESK